MDFVLDEHFAKLAIGDSSGEGSVVEATLVQSEQFFEVLSLDVVKGLPAGVNLFCLAVLDPFRYY